MNMYSKALCVLVLVMSVDFVWGMAKQPENPTPWYKPWSRKVEKKSGIEGLKGSELVENPHKLWWADRKRYESLEQNLSLILRDGFSKQNQPGIEATVEELAEYSKPRLIETTNPQGVKKTIELPAHVGVFSPNGWYVRLFKHAIKEGDVEGIAWTNKKIADVKLANIAMDDAPDALHLIGPKREKSGPAETAKKLFALGLAKDKIDEWDASGKTLLRKVAEHVSGHCIASNYTTVEQFEQLQKKRNDKKNDESKGEGKQESEVKADLKDDHERFLKTNEEKAREWVKFVEVLLENKARDRENHDGKVARDILEGCPSCKGKGKGTEEKLESPCKDMLALLQKY